jgi:AAA domain-containing protein
MSETCVANPTPTKAGSTSPSPTFFERNIRQRKEIIEGLLREQQLCILAGPYGTGKSPLLADLVMHILYGIPWCGRKVQRRPIIHFDFETPGPVYKANLRNIADRLGVSVPKVPDELDVYLEHDEAKEPGTQKLLDTFKQKTIQGRLDLIEKALKDKPDALTVLDPLELMVRVDTTKKQPILSLYADFRLLLSKYSKAAMIVTFNLRKMMKGGNPLFAGRTGLLQSPREWLEEVCGTLDILNRSDVRLGLDLYEDDVRVINGIRRSEEMQPLLIRPAVHNNELAGFELCPPESQELKRTLTTKQLEYWNSLPMRFRFEEIADKSVPRASLQRLLARVKSLGLVVQQDDGWVKGDSH